MSKNILIFSDGTGQAGGLKPEQHLSNVYKLYRASRITPDNNINPNTQVAFYDPGLGSAENDGGWWTHPLKSLRKTLSALTGAGIGRNIADCYEAVLKHYRKGDRIYLFGFSRGAYTVRNVAGVIHLCGIPRYIRDNDNKRIRLPRYGKGLRAIAEEAVNIYEHGAGKSRVKYAPQRRELARRFRQKYHSNDIENANKSNVAPYFIGVFDTIAALGAKGLRRFLLFATGGVLLLLITILIGWLFNVLLSLSLSLLTTSIVTFVILSLIVSVSIYRARVKIIRDYPIKSKTQRHFTSWHFKFFDRYLDNRTNYARHAIAIDETRADFARVPWGIKRNESALNRDKNEIVWFKQLWFSGNHTDIGGGYDETESRLSDISLEWMIKQATEIPHPILIDENKLNIFPDPTGMQHSEVKFMYEGYPNWIPKKLKTRLVWKEKYREISNDAPLHSTVKKRGMYQEGVQQYESISRYRPENLQHHEQFSELFRNIDDNQT